jgi:predicted metal-dependent enzyme (double-stranded beta helix superfamily)
MLFGNGAALPGQARLSRARLGSARPAAGTRLSQARLSQIVGAVAARPDRWSELVRFDAGRRWYQRLDLADDHEVWLLSWLPGQSTGFHDHGRAVGAFAVAQGRIQERTVAAGGRPPVRHLTVAEGGVRRFGSHHVHDVVNAFAEPAITVHAYSPPLTAMRRFELTDSGLVHTGTECAEQDW